MSLRDRLEMLNRTGAIGKSAPAPPRPRTLETALGGIEVTNSAGTFFLRRQRMPRTMCYGPRMLDEAPRFPRPWLDRLGLQELEPERVMYLDTETTGLAGGSGTYAFLIGLAWFDAEFLHLEQLIMREHAEEKAVLLHLQERLESVTGLVTFNGKTFDAQLLQTRFMMNRRRVTLDEVPHLDLLHLSRRLWGGGLQDCRLETLETEVLGLPRQDDVPGWLVPQIYFRFLKNGDARGMAQVAEHNRRDVLAMVGLTALAGLYLADPLAQVLAPYTDVGLGRWLMDLGDQALARQLLERAVGQPLARPLRRQARLRLATMLSRAGERDRAVDLWGMLLAEHPADADAAEEMAKHLEHKARDLGAALSLVETVLAVRTLSPSRRKRFVVRWERLRGKLETGRGTCSQNT